jgi:hypothetical protein
MVLQHETGGLAHYTGVLDCFSFFFSGLTPFRPSSYPYSMWFVGLDKQVFFSL